MLLRKWPRNLGTQKRSINIHTSKKGRRADLDNRFFRSDWEANYCRFLKFQKVEYKYESKEFWFEDIKRGCRSYKPDLYLPKEDRYIEIKGWLDNKSFTKLKRFKKYYPEDFAKLTAVVGSMNTDAYRKMYELGIRTFEFYREMNSKLDGIIPNWERG